MITETMRLDVTDGISGLRETVDAMAALKVKGDFDGGEAAVTFTRIIAGQPHLTVLPSPALLRWLADSIEAFGESLG